MKYRIASDKLIKNILTRIFKKYRTIDSQNKLKSLVDKELNKRKRKYKVSSSRLRRVAIDSNLIKLEVLTREGDPKKLITRCPVCGSELKRLKNLTIWGGEVTIELRCPKCKYWTGKKKQMPIRYIFHRKM